MNEFYEAVSNLLEEMRCDSGEREYTLQPENSDRIQMNFRDLVYRDL